MKPAITICETNVEAIRPLRHTVLRAGLPAEAAIFDGDDEPATRHIAALGESGAIIGCVTIVRRPWNGEPAWQLRGMAVDARQRGQGIGQNLLSNVEQIVLSSEPPPLLWCNARTSAVGFYARMGWQAVGQEFFIETAGPHYRMLKRLLDVS